MNTGTKLTPKMIGDLAEKYKLGKTTTELALEYNMSKATVCRALRKVGIEPERKDSLFTIKEISEDQRKQIIDDYKQGTTIKDLCSKYNLSYSVITKVLSVSEVWDKRKIVKFNSNKLTKIIQMENGDTKKVLGLDEQKELCNKYVNGPNTKQELADEYKINIDTVSAILRRNQATIKRYIINETKDLIFDEYKKGISSVSDLSKVYQINPETIKYWLRKEGLFAINEDEIISKVVTTADLRKRIRSGDIDLVEVLEDMVANPETPSRDRISATKLLWERGYGRPREDDESIKEEKETVASQILKLIKK